MTPGRHGDAVSPVLGVILMVAVTVLLAAIILALLSWLPLLCDPFPSNDIRIVGFYDYDERSGHLFNYDSRIVLQNFGSKDLPNRQITGAFYRDGVRVRCNLESFHGGDPPHSIHTGYETMGGVGCQGETWEVGAKIVIDFNNGTFLPGQLVRVDIIDIGTGCVISSDSFKRGPDPSR